MTFQTSTKAPATNKGDRKQPTHVGVPARTVDLVHAAELLQISSETLLGWERTFGYPQPVGTGHTYELQDLLALKAALGGAHSVAAAIRTAQISSTSVRASR